jgi:hypothetical protein
MSPRRAILTSATVLVLLAAAYGGYWTYAAGLLRDGIDGWIAARHAEGVEVRLRTVSVGGFPFTLEVEVGDVVAATAAGDIAWQLRTPGVRVTAAPWDFRRIAFAVPNPTEGFVANVATGERTNFTARAAAGEAAFDRRGRLLAGTVDLDAPTATGRNPFLPLSARLASLNYDQREPTATEVTLRATEIGLPPVEGLALGDVMQSLVATFVVHGPLPRAPTEPQLAAWRAAGGWLDIRFLEARWGPLNVSAKGEARLDDDLQPTGVLSTSTRGYREAVSAAETTGQVTRQQGAQIRLVLDLLATHPENGAAPQLDVDLSLHDRHLKAGVMPLADVPRVHWPRE